MDNKCRAFTSLEQSRKLAEILPLKSADTYIGNYIGKSGKVDGTNVHYYPKGESFGAPEIIDSWSLAALLNYLREIDFFPEIEADEHGVTMSINYYDEEEARLLTPVHNIKVKAESFIDACVAMIERLHELKIL